MRKIELIYCIFWKECDHGLVCPAALNDETKAKLKNKKEGEIVKFTTRPECFDEIDLA